MMHMVKTRRLFAKVYSKGKSCKFILLFLVVFVGVTVIGMQITGLGVLGQKINNVTGSIDRKNSNGANREVFGLGGKSRGQSAGVAVDCIENPRQTEDLIRYYADLAGKRQVMSTEIQKDIKQLREQMASGHIDEAQVLIAKLTPDESTNPLVLAEDTIFHLLYRNELVLGTYALKRYLTLEAGNRAMLALWVNLAGSAVPYADAVNFLQRLKVVHPEASFNYDVAIGMLQIATGKIATGIERIEGVKSKIDQMTAFEATVAVGEGYEKEGDIQKSVASFQLASRQLEEYIRQRLSSGEPLDRQVSQLDDLQIKLVTRLFALGRWHDGGMVLQRLSQRMPDDPRVVALFEKYLERKQKL